MIPKGAGSMRSSAIAIKTVCAALILAGGLFAAPPVPATEHGLSDYLLGYSLPMTGYTPPPGIYFSDTFYLYQGSASANVNFPFHQNTLAGVRLNFLFNIVQTAWVTDVKVFGGSLGFAALVPFGGERTSASLEFTGPLGLFRPRPRWVLRSTQSTPRRTTKAATNCMWREHSMNISRLASGWELAAIIISR